ADAIPNGREVEHRWRGLVVGGVARSTGVVFFQAEDGIRDGHVTGVQTCALPIWPPRMSVRAPELPLYGTCTMSTPAIALKSSPRSEERRVGKECRSPGWRGHYKKTR